VRLVNQYLLGIALSLLMPAVMAGQSYFVQFRSPELDSDSTCRVLENVLRVQTGWTSVRAESRDGNVLALCSGDLTFERADFEEWLAQLGLTLSCYRFGVVGQDRILRLDAECQDANRNPQRE
jgi:hypothetical protein